MGLIGKLIPYYTIAGSEYLKKGQAYKVTVHLPPKADKKDLYQKLELVIGIHRGVWL